MEAGKVISAWHFEKGSRDRSPGGGGGEFPQAGAKVRAELKNKKKEVQGRTSKSEARS